MSVDVRLSGNAPAAVAAPALPPQPQQAQHLGIAVLIDDIHALVPVNKIMNLTGEGESPQAAIAGVDIVLAS